MGTVDLFVVTHHGQPVSNAPVLVHAIAPRVAIMNNGTRKGGQPDAMRVLFTSPGLEDLWQLHFSQLSGQEYTVPGMFIANVVDDRPASMPIEPIAAPAPASGRSAAAGAQRARVLDQGVGARRRLVHGHERAQRVYQELRREPQSAQIAGQRASSGSLRSMARLVAADASPLIGLANAGALHLLRELFGTVTITRLVKDEVTGRPDRPGARELDAAMREGWVRVAPAPPETWRYTGIDPGEASTIALAAQHEGALVLMDDILGAAQAAALGLEVLGLGGLLLAAKRARLIESVQPLVARLAGRGFTFPDDVRRALLTRCR